MNAHIHRLYLNNDVYFYLTNLGAQMIVGEWIGWIVHPKTTGVGMMGAPDPIPPDRHRVMSADHKDGDWTSSTKQHSSTRAARQTPGRNTGVRTSEDCFRITVGLVSIFAVVVVVLGVSTPPTTAIPLAAVFAIVVLVFGLTAVARPEFVRMSGATGPTWFAVEIAKTRTN